MDEISNPFKENKNVNWAKKAQTKHKQDPISKQNLPKKKVKMVRVAKSFKVYPGKIIKDFDKRVNKLQVIYDDLDCDKDYVDNGKYMMFLMSFAEKYNLHELYAQVNKEGNLKIDSTKLKEFKKKLN